MRISLRRRVACFCAVALASTALGFLCLPTVALAGRLQEIMVRGPFPLVRGVLLRQQTGNVTAGAWSEPVTTDWDGDGDEDLLVGSGYGDLLYFERRADGLLTEPLQMLPEPMSLLNTALVPSPVSPAVADWNADGHPDVIVGLRGRVYLCRRNNGGLDPPVELRSGPHGLGALIASRAPQAGHLAPCPADLDGDGDMDLLLGDDQGYVWWVANEGSGAAFQLAAPVLLNAGGTPLNIGLRARVTVGDWDGDGQTDVIIGCASGTLALCRGTPQGLAPPVPIFGVGAPAGPPDTPWPRDLAPCCSYWFGRSSGLRLLLGDRRGYVAVLASAGELVARMEGYAQAVNAPVDAGRCAVASAVDWDGDGDLDLVAGGEDGYVQMWERVADDPPLFGPGRRVVDREGPVRAQGRENGDAAAGLAWPCAADLDRDGDVDLLVGQGSGTIRVWLNNRGFRSIGEVLVGGTVLALPGATTVSALDYDRDGDTDVFVGNRVAPGASDRGHLSSEFILYLENVANKGGQPPLFAKAVQLDAMLVGLGSRSEKSDADILGLGFLQPVHWDRDGVLDFLASTRFGAFIFRSNSPRGAYPRLELHVPGPGMPVPLLPPAWSTVAARLTGHYPGLLCGMEETGWIVWYPRDSLLGPAAELLSLSDLTPRSPL